jgi:MFS family permease
MAARLTQSPRLISGIAAVGALPWLLAGLPSGAIADRVERRRLMFGVEIFRAVMLAILAVSSWLGQDSLLMLYLVVFGIGLGQTVFAAAASAEIPLLVHDKNLGRANGYLMSAEMASAETIGPAIGGALFGVAVALPFIVDGASFMVSAVLIALAIPRRQMMSGPAIRRASMRAELREGWRHFADDDLLMLLAAAIASLAFCQAMVLSTLVLTALETFDLGDVGFGLLLGCTSIGSIVGGLIAGRVDQRFGAARTLTVVALVASASYLVVGSTTTWWIAGFGLAVEGCVVILGNASSMTLRQRRIPNHLLGRVGNIMRLCIYGVVPLGALAGGWLADVASLRTPFFCAALIQVIAVGLFSPALIRRCRLAEHRPANDE